MSRVALHRQLCERVVNHTSRLAAILVERMTLAPYQHADPELQPGVREMRERLGRLAQEPGT